MRVGLVQLILKLKGFPRPFSVPQR